MSDTTARDQLAGVARRALPMSSEAIWDATSHAIAREVQKAGWRPPIRTVSTVEELDSLAEDAIVIDVLGTPHVHSGRMWIEGGFRMPDDRTAEEMFRDVGHEFPVVWEPE